MAHRLHRKDVPLEQTWDLESLYPTVSHWETDLTALERLVTAYEETRPRMGMDAAGLLAVLRLRDEISQTLARVTYYADNRLAEDQTDPARQGLRQRSDRAATLVKTALSSFRPDLLAMEEGTWERFLLEHRELFSYRTFLETIQVERAHQLGTEAEAIVGAFSELGQAPFTIWQNTTSADVSMEAVRNDSGDLIPMSYAALGRLYQSPNRSVRKAAFESVSAGYAKHRNTIAATLAAAVRRDVVLARIRRYPSALGAALAAVRFPEAALRNLLQTAEAGSEHLRRYMGLRNRALKLQQQAPYDMSVPLDHEVALTVTIPEGLQLVGKATAPLGAAYQDLLRRADRERWVDWADNVGKSPVPYSRDCYGYHPAVNMVWHGTLSDVTVLAHELGHALHTSFSQASQPYVYSSYTGLLAETAAIVNELLLVQYLVGTSSERALRRYLLTKAIDSFITNFFYASIATTFQLELHDMAERGVPLTYQSMTEVNTAIYHRFYGDTLEVTPQGIGSQWLRVPQHYFGFYSYQYVTGITAAAALTASILTESATAAPRYLTFLKAGSSLPPLEVLRTVGVDLENQTSTQLAVATFSNLVTTLENT